MRDLEPFNYPKLKDLRKIRYRSVCLGSYIPWDVKKHVEVIQKDNQFVLLGIKQLKIIDKYVVSWCAYLDKMLLGFA